MNIEYYILNPTGNITSIVTTVVPENLRKKVADTIMKNEPSVEQVGFFEKNENGVFLNMAGGEFCLNATLSATILNSKLSEKNSENTVISVSGCALPINTATVNTKSGILCKAEMPKPKSIENITLCYEKINYNFSLVRFEGISHLIYENPFDKSLFEKAIKVWADELKENALGIMFFDKENSFLTPLVYIKNADTLFWEGSCASGSCAIGYYLLNSKNAKAKFDLTEPSGNLIIETVNNSVFLTGNVKIIAHKNISLKEEVV